MRKQLLTLIAVLAISTQLNSQTSKWGLSYAAEFTKIEIAGMGQSYDESLTVNNVNLHYSILSWANPFQIGPLVSMRFGSADGESFSDFQVGLNLGYNFSDSFALVMDTYKVFDDIDDHGIFVFKPALEFMLGGKLGAQLGYAKYAYSGDYRENIGADTFKAGGLLVGLKYKF